jgi:hypothetical protein
MRKWTKGWVREDELTPEDGIAPTPAWIIEDNIRREEERQRSGLARKQEADYAHLMIRWALEKLADIRDLSLPERTHYKKLYKRLGQLPEERRRKRSTTRFGRCALAGGRCARTTGRHV